MKNTMKKIFAGLLAFVMLFALAACGGEAKDDGYTVAIVKQMDHASLDEIANAVAAQLDALAEKNGVTISYEIFSGQGDQSTLMQIGDQAVADGVDVIIPIATTAAQIMATCAEESGTPVVFAVVSDPATALLTDIDYVTGISDALNTAFIMDMLFAQNPAAEKIGLLYSLSEPNSATPIAEAKAYLDAKGIAYVEKTGNNASEIIAAASDLVGRVDAVFTPTDNVVMASEAAVAEALNEAGIPHYAGADSFVSAGAFATCGVNYTELGTKTADIAFDILLGGEVGDFHVMEGGIITVNTETAAACGLDYAVFSEMANTVNAIATIVD